MNKLIEILNIGYPVLYGAMVLSYLGLSLTIPSLKMKIVGVLLTIVNGLLFYK